MNKIPSIYMGLQSSFQALIDAVERRENTDSLEKKQNNLIGTVEIARQFNLLDFERAESLKKLEQLDIQNTLATLNQLLELQKLVSDNAIEELTKRCELLELTTSTREAEFMQKEALWQREKQELREALLQQRNQVPSGLDCVPDVEVERARFIEKGIPYVKGQRTNLQADFGIILKMTAVSKLTINRFLGEMIEDVPSISKECFDWLNEQDSFEPGNWRKLKPFEPGKCNKDTYKLLVVPSKLKRIKEKKWILDNKGTLIPDPDKQEKTLIVPLTLKNLRTLCSSPLDGKNNMPVFPKKYSWEVAFEQYEPAPTYARIYFTRKQVVGEELCWKDQKSLVEGNNLEVTPLFIRMWAHCFSILEHNYCTERNESHLQYGQKLESFARFPSFLDGSYVKMGNFLQGKGLSVYGDDGEAYKRNYDNGFSYTLVGVAPGRSCEGREETNNCSIS